MNEPSSGFDPVEELVDSFLERYRRGERPSLTEYTVRHPELAEPIRALFPALLVVEELGSRDGPASEPQATAAGAGAPMPQRLGDYLLLRPIGSGGMEMVYEAIQESLGRHVALKTLPLQQLGDATRLERFRARRGRLTDCTIPTSATPSTAGATCCRWRGLDWDTPPYPAAPDSPAALGVVLPVRAMRVFGEVLEPEVRRAAELAEMNHRIAAKPDDAEALIHRGWLFTQQKK
jgi:hypothetical protein